MIVLEEEFLTAMDQLDERAVAWLRQQGVSERALHLWPGPIGTAPIETHPTGYFELAEDMRRAYVQPVLSGGEFTDIVDLIAWFPNQPNQWWTRLYSGCPLGADQLDKAELLGEPARCSCRSGRRSSPRAARSGRSGGGAWSLR